MNDLLVGAAGQDDLCGQFHVAAAAGSVVDSDDDAAAFDLAEPFIAGEEVVADGCGEGVAAADQFGLAFAKFTFPVGEIGEAALSFGAGGFGITAGGVGLALGGFALLHQVEFAVFDADDSLAAHVDFVGQGAVLVVLLGLVLLDGVFFDQLAFGLGFEFEFFAFAFEVFDAVFGGFEGGQGGLGASFEFLAEGADGVQLEGERVEFLVAVLKDQQFFDDIEHGWPSFSGLRVPGRTAGVNPGGFEHFLAGGFPNLPEGKREQTTMNSKRRGTSWLGTAMAMAVGFGVGGAAGEAPSALDVARQLNQAFIGVADTVSPAVVVITVAHRPGFEDLFDEANPWLEMLPPQFRERFREQYRRDPGTRRRQPPVFDGQGSGLVIREDGYIVTNGHVIDGAEQIKVRFKNGKEYTAEVRGVDAQSDVAVLKIDATGLPTAKFADSDKVRVGEYAIAIGAPFDLDYSVTVGHVSAKGRSRVIRDPAMDQDFIQTDASINPGNSGGPLVNIEGEVVGINTLIRGLQTGIGFAVPSNLAKEVSAKLIVEGKYTRAWLGVAVMAVGEDEEMRDLLRGTESGVVVRQIEKDSPASKSELKTGDVIAAVDGRPVRSAQDLRNEVRAKGVGSPVTLDVVRAGKSLKIKVQPEEWPDEVKTAAVQSGVAPSGEAKDLGMVVKPATKDLAREHGVEMAEGLLVTQIEAGSVAERKGVQKGDIVTEVNQAPVTTLRAFREAINAADLKRGVLLNLVRDGVSRLVVLKDAGE